MATGRRTKKKTAGKRQKAVHVMTDLDQVRVLADPLRVRILERLCEEEHTTKQVAALLGEKPTKLYHHVEALEKVGLIQLTRTRQNRGTLEKYYQGIARLFKTDPTLFSGRDESHRDEDQQTLRSVVSTILDSTHGELDALIAGDDGSMETEGVLTFAEISGTPKQLEAIRKRIDSVLEEMERQNDPESAADTSKLDRRFRLTLAFFPLDRSSD